MRRDTSGRLRRCCFQTAPHGRHALLRLGVIAATFAACQGQPPKASPSPTRVLADVRRPIVVATPQRSDDRVAVTPTVADAGTATGMPLEQQGQPFGTPNSLVSLGAFDPKGRWVYYCQAEGDSTAASLHDARSTFLGNTFKPYLWRVGSGTEHLEALAAASPNGRYIVAISASKDPQLIDVETHQVESLSALDLDMRADVETGNLRSVAFSPDSSRLALLVHEKVPRIVVRNLGDHSNAEVIPVGNKVWRVAFDASSKFVVAAEVLEDTNRNGRMDWPLPVRPLADSRCRAPIPAYAAYVATGDATRVSIAPVRGGKSRLVPGFIAALGQSLVVRQPNGTLWLSDGRRIRPMSSPDCDAQIIAVAPEHGRILTGCRDAKGRALVEIDSARGYRKFEVDVPASSADLTSLPSDTYVALYSGSRSYLIDLATERVLSLVDRDQALAQGPSGILLRRGNAIVLFNPTAQSSVILMENVLPGTRIVSGDGVALVGGVVVSAAEGRVLGTLAQQALALTSNGCGVVSMGKASDNELFARGPLSWSCPVP